MNDPFEEIVEKLRKLCDTEDTKKKIIGNLLNIEEKHSLHRMNKLSEEMKIFNDSIHGHVELHPLLVKIIDTPQFQRLRNIKQLGAGYWVYPGASHNRFEHSIGVAYLAGCLLKSLQEKQAELNITDQDKLCVQIAGLCHDLGHGPFSHLFDNRFIPETLPGRKWKHEEASCKMFEHMVNENRLEEEMEKHGLKLIEDMIFIKELIQGVDISQEWSAKGRTTDKSFLYEIVANKRTGIDVDKWDYFARDCHHLGISKSFDHQRLLKLTRVCEVEGRKYICFRDKEKDNIYDMFCTRYNLHRQAYQHKTVNIIEIMIKDALVKADSLLQISSTIDDMAEYSRLTDQILERILLKLPEDELQEAREILEAIAMRRLPKFVKEARLPEDMNPERQDLKKTWKEAVKEKLNPEDFEIDIVTMDHGMKGKNLTENVYFYSKKEPNKAFKIKKDEMTSILPEKFYERLVRVYYRGSDEKAFEEAQKCFAMWHENNFGLRERTDQA